jgi:hypothetical protein
MAVRNEHPSAQAVEEEFALRQELLGDVFVDDKGKLGDHSTYNYFDLSSEVFYLVFVVDTDVIQWSVITDTPG